MSRVLFVLLALIPSLQDKPAPVPDAEAQRKAEKVIREVYGDAAKKPAPDRIAFAKKMLQQGIETKDDPSSQYVMFREAREVAARAGDAATALQAIEEMGRRFEVDVLQSKVATLAVIVQDPRPVETYKVVAEAYLKLAEQAALAGDYESAEKAAASGVVSARKAKDISLVGRADAKARENVDLKLRLGRLKKARDVLATTPGDPAANLEVGQFECFFKGNWEAGLPLLVKGSDESLRALAQKDVGAPTASQDQIALADGWWARAEKESGVARQRIRERAAHWYGQAAKDASGLSRVKIDRRLQELGRAAPDFALPGGDPGMIGWWRLDDGQGTTLQDASGKNHHGSLLKEGEWLDGRVGKALKFRGKQSQVVIADTEALRVAGDLTIAVWGRIDSRTTDWVRLIGKGASNTRNYGLWFESPPGNRILFQQGDSPSTYTSVFGTVTTAVGAWYHLAGVVEGNLLHLYVNGKKDGSQPRVKAPPTSAEPFTLGAADFHEGLIGALDDARIYNRALTDQEIEQLASPK